MKGPKGDAPGSARIPAWAVVALVLALAFDVWWRCHTIGPTVRDRLGFAPYPVVTGEAEPLDCDEAAYAYIGRGIAHGRVMYRDLSENKPPLGYWLYALAVKVGGADELTVRLMPIPYVLATVALVWWLGIRLGGPWAGSVAAFLFALLSTDPYLYGNGANLEHFLDLFAVGSLAAMVRGVTRRFDRRWFLVAGALVALASLVKQVAALHGPVYALALLVIDRGERPEGGRRGWARFGDLAALALGFAIPWAMAGGILAWQGAGPDAWEDIVGYGSALATAKVASPRDPHKFLQWFAGRADPQGRFPWPFGGTDYLAWWGTGTWPLWVAAVPGLAWMLARRGSTRRLAAAWTLAAWAQVALPGLFWQHYYLLPTAGVALAVALPLASAAGSIARVGRPRLRDFGTIALGGVVAVALVGSIAWAARIQVRDYLLVAPEALTARYKGGGQWIWLRTLGRELDRRASAWPGARPTFYLWGWQSPLFLYGNLDGVTRHFFADPLLEDYAKGHHRDHPIVRPRVDRIMRDLEAHPPSIVLVAYPPFPALVRFLDRGYRRVAIAGLNATSPDGVGFWVDLDHAAAFEALGQARAAGVGSARPAAAR